MAPTESPPPEKEVIRKGKVEEIVEPVPEVIMNGYVNVQVEVGC